MDTKKLRQKILDLAIRGKLVPQDPNDEPASVLLDRIRAEKERLIKEGKIKRSKKSASDDEIEAPFEIPESWEWTTIGELCDVVRGGSPRPAGSKEFYDGPIPFLKVADLTHDEGIYVYMAQNSIKEAGLSKTRMIEADTLLLTNSGATLGVPKINTFPTTINDGIAAFLFLSNDIKLYVYWFLKSKTNSFRRIDQGAAQPNLNTDLIKAEQMPLPPLSEQRRIVDEIERWFTLIDELESNEGDLLKAIDKAKSKILDLAIHGKLVPQDPNDEATIDLIKRVNFKFECSKNQEKDFKIPHNWYRPKLKDVCKDFIVPQRDKPTRFDGDIPWCRIEDIEGKYLNGSLSNQNVSMDLIKEMNMRICPIGTVLCSCSASLGIQAITTVPCCTNQTFIGIVPNGGILQEDYLFYFLKSQSKLFYELGTGTTIKYISRIKFEEMFIPLPPYQEQLRIVAKIEELFAVLDSIKESLE